jgi:hypothetical protein
METIKMKTLNVLVVMLAVATFAIAAPYLEIHDWATVENGTGATSHFSSASEAGNTYHQLSLSSSPAITKVDPAGNATTLVDTLAWAIATGGSTSMTGFYGFGIDGDYLQFAESSSDAVWRVNKNTGAISAFASSADILSHTQSVDPSITSVQLLSSNAPSGGKHYFYEGQTDSILVADGTSVGTYVSSADLVSLTGSDTVSGGMALDGSGNLIFASNSSDSMFAWSDSLMSGFEVLSTAAITAVTGASSAGFGDIFFAPDGFIYFYESAADSILRFNPTFGPGSLSTVLTEAELLAGPAGSDLIFGLSWYDGPGLGIYDVGVPGELAFNVNGSKGFYAVPEPTTALIFAIGGLGLLRRRLR